jgi:plastocyanin
VALGREEHQQDREQRDHRGRHGLAPVGAVHLAHVLSHAQGDRPEADLVDHDQRPEDLVPAPGDGEDRQGDTITWTNTSAAQHTTTDDPSKVATRADAQLPSGAQAWDSGMIAPGRTFAHTFDVVGTYKHVCTVHESAGMVGTITVR